MPQNLQVKLSVPILVPSTALNPIVSIEGDMKINMLKYCIHHCGHLFLFFFLICFSFFSTPTNNTSIILKLIVDQITRIALS